jgi:hypothetical protein
MRRRKTLEEKQQEREQLLEQAKQKLETLTRRQLKRFLAGHRKRTAQPQGSSKQ